jgi:hypothetical protein
MLKITVPGADDVKTGQCSSPLTGGHASTSSAIRTGSARLLPPPTPSIALPSRESSTVPTTTTGNGMVEAENNSGPAESKTPEFDSLDKYFTRANRPGSRYLAYPWCRIPPPPSQRAEYRLTTLSSSKRTRWVPRRRTFLSFDIRGETIRIYFLFGG